MFHFFWKNTKRFVPLKKNLHARAADFVQQSAQHGRQRRSGLWQWCIFQELDPNLGGDSWDLSFLGVTIADKDQENHPTLDALVEDHGSTELVAACAVEPSDTHWYSLRQRPAFICVLRCSRPTRIAKKKGPMRARANSVPDPHVFGLCPSCSECVLPAAVVFSSATASIAPGPRLGLSGADCSKHAVKTGRVERTLFCTWEVPVGINWPRVGGFRCKCVAACQMAAAWCVGRGRSKELT